MAHTRNKLRSGDVWVERSSAYRRFDSYLLSAEASAPVAAGLKKASRLKQANRDRLA